MSTFSDFVDHLKKISVYPEFRVIQSGVNEPECKIDGKTYLMFSSNNYLGLTQNPEVVNAGIGALKKYGVGPGGSRVISGNVDVIEELEAKIAQLTGTEDVVTFPTGYMANIGVFAALMDTGMGELFGYGSFNKGEAIILSDEFNHGSIVDGCRLSSAKKIIFKHNDLNDLVRKIQANPVDRKLIVTEGVFSLDGEITPIKKYIEIAQSNNALLMVDDAHGIGVLGKNGGGIGEYFDCASEIDILMGCMDKAFGGTGGYLAGKKSLIDYLKVSTRSSLLSSALPTGMAGAMIESVKQIQQGSSLREMMNKNASSIREGLRRVGFTILGKDNIPALALYVGDEKLGLTFQDELWNEGIYCQLVRWPAVPVGTARFRIIAMAQHKDKHIERFLNASEIIGKKLGIIK